MEIRFLYYWELKKHKQPQTKEALPFSKKTANIERIQFNSNEGYRPDHCIDTKFFVIDGTRVNMKLI